MRSHVLILSGIAVLVLAGLIWLVPNHADVAYVPLTSISKPFQPNPIDASRTEAHEKVNGPDNAVVNVAFSPEDKALGTVRGRVVDVQGRPVGEVVVAARRNCYNTGGIGAVARDAISDVDGYFTMDGLMVQTYKREAGQHCTWRFEALYGNSSGFAEHDFTRSAFDSLIQITLRATESLSGIVVDERGNAIGQASIQFKPKYANQSLEQAVRTSNLGYFSADLIAGQYTLEAIASGFSSSSVVAFTGAGKPLLITLSRGSVLSGRIVDLQRRGVADVSLRVVREGSPALFERTGRSEADGYFQITGLSPGQHKIVLDPAQGDYVLASPPSLWKIPESGPLEGVILSVEQSSAIEGLVIDGNTKEPIRHVQVLGESEFFPHGDSDLTDDQGKFRLDGLGEGIYTLSLRHSTNPEISTTVKTVRGQVATGVRLELDLRRTISGHVVDEQGELVSGAAVAGHAVNGSWRSTVLTDEEGKFSIYLPGAVDNINLQAFSKYSASPLVGPCGAGSNSKTLTLAGLAEIEGQVVDASGRGLPGRRVTVEAHDDRGRALLELPGTTREKSNGGRIAAATDGGGRFRLYLRAPAKYAFTAHDGELSSSPVAINVGGGGVPDVTLELKSGRGAVAGAVFYGGSPAPGVSVRAGTTHSVTDAAGAYRLDDVEAGEVTMQVVRHSSVATSGTAVTLSRIITVEADRTTRTDIDLTDNTGVVAGDITRDGQAVSDGHIHILGDFFSADVATGTDGTFRLDCIPAGTYAVFARDATGATRSQEIVTEAGRVTEVSFDLSGGTLEGAVTGIRATGVVFLGLLNKPLHVTEATLDELNALRPELAAERTLEATENFQFSDLKPGPYTLIVVNVPPGSDDMDEHATLLRVHTESVEIGPNEVTEVFLTF